MFRFCSVCEPALGRFSGHEPNEVEPVSSEVEMSMTPWPPVPEPDTPVNTFSCMLVPCPAGRGNLLRSRVYIG